MHTYIYIYIKHGLHLLLGTDLNALLKKRLSYEEILHNKVDYIDSINLNITTPFYNTHIYIKQLSSPYTGFPLFFTDKIP